MHRHGVPLAHSIVRFLAASDADVFTGPYSFATLVDGEPATFAFVTCRVAETRDGAFRRALATVIADSLAPAVALERLFIAFDPVDPANHFRGHELRPAEAPPSWAR